jgi:4-hydroxybenzoate polyprenyltransferase
LRDWLRLFRAQTGLATYFGFSVPYLIAGGNPIIAVGLLPVGLLMHYASFGHNSVMDYWHDVHDPAKAHHPLQSGRISLGKAHIVLHSMLALSALVCIAVTLLLSPRPEVALAFLALYMVFGHAYNDGLGKHTRHSWLPISLCFMALAGWGWFLATDRFDVNLALLLLVAFTAIAYQIGFEGNLKDLCSDKVNLLHSLARAMECKYEGGKLAMIQYEGYTFKWLRVFDTVMLWFLCMNLNAYMGLLVLAIASVMQWWLINRMERGLSHGLERDRLLGYLGKVEVLEFLKIMSPMLYSAGNILVFIIYIPLGLVYFTVMNRLLWGTVWAPRV